MSKGYSGPLPSSALPRFPSPSFPAPRASTRPVNFPERITAASQGIVSGMGPKSGVGPRKDLMGNMKPGQEAYGAPIQGTGGHTYHKLAGGGYVDESGKKVSGFSKPSSGGKGKGAGAGAGGTAMPSVGGRNIEFSLGPAPTLREMEIPYDQFTERLAQVNDPAKLGALADQYNAPAKRAFEEYQPAFKADLAQMQQLGRDYMGGRIPLDVAKNIGRSSAAANLGSGLFGGGLGRNLVSRDLGRTSLDLQQAGAGLFQQSFGLAQQAQQLTNPISVANLMVNPRDIFDTVTTQAQYNNQIFNANLINAWQSRPLPGQYVLGKGYATFAGGYSNQRELDPTVQLNWGKDAGKLAGKPIGGIVGTSLQNASRNWTASLAYTPQLAGLG